MIEYSYATINPIRYPQAGTLPGNHPETASRSVWSTGNTFPAAIYRTTAISDIATRGIMIGSLLFRQSALTPLYMELGYSLVTHAAPPRPDALDLLERWYATDSHQPSEYWDELQAEVTANRFTARKNGG